jgi:ABC-2 type transport system permease protein/sodium transport system permease protein
MSITPPALGRFARLARKELTEILRDRRTVLTLLLMPLLLYPLLSIAFSQFLISGAISAEAPKYRVGFLSDDEAESVFRFLSRGEESLARRGAFREGPTPRKDAITRPKLETFVTGDLEDAVRRGQVEIGARLDPAGAFQERVRRPLAVDMRLFYRDESVPGLEALHYVERLCREANATFLSEKLRAVGIEERAEPLRPIPMPLPERGSAKNQLFAVLVPLILILMTITGAVYPAIDLTAGERERGTLEVLIAAPVPRLALLGAKYVAVVTVAVLTALVNLGSMTLTLWTSPVGRHFLDERSLSFWLLPEVFGLLLLLAAFFSAVLLALTSFARSFKEAQAYLIPLMLASLLPGMIGMVPGLHLEGPLAVAPLINIVLLARDLFDGHANPLSAAVVVLSTSLYAVAAIAVAARTFGAEAVLYAQQGGWGELFQRPQRPRATATASSALLCLALMFPLSVVLNRLIVEFREEPAKTILAVQAATTVTLFGACPMLGAWFGRVLPISGFRLKLPGLFACIAALLLGVGLWPLISEVEIFIRSLGIATLSAEQLNKVEDELAKLFQSVPLPLVVLVFGLLPAVFEELFFRGYLFSALLTARRPWTAILTSAVLFGVFHLIAGGTLAVERMVPSALFGVVLGWLCWKSGSVLPGMLLHTLNNSLLVSIGRYKSWLLEAGWLKETDEHLPPYVLLSGLAVSVVGLIWIRVLPRPQDGSATAEDG